MDNKSARDAAALLCAAMATVAMAGCAGNDGGDGGDTASSGQASTTEDEPCPPLDGGSEGPETKSFSLDRSVLRVKSRTRQDGCHDAYPRTGPRPR